MINSVECMRVCVCGGGGGGGGGRGWGLRGREGDWGERRQLLPFVSPFCIPPSPSPLACHDIDCERQYIKQNILIKFVSIHLQIWVVYTNRT